MLAANDRTVAAITMTRRAGFGRVVATDVWCIRSPGARGPRWGRTTPVENGAREADLTDPLRQARLPRVFRTLDVPLSPEINRRVVAVVTLLTS
jgi:hypothetical protein